MTENSCGGENRTNLTPGRTLSFLESSEKESSPPTEEEGEESCGLLEAQVLSFSQVVRDNAAEFIRHVHGSHVVRTLLHVLGGCLGPPRTETRPGKCTQTHTHAGMKKMTIFSGYFFPFN